MWILHGPLTRYVNCGSRMGQEWRELYPRHRLQRKALVIDSSIHHGTCVTLVPWCMSGSLTSSGRENVPGIAGACTTHTLTYLTRGPLYLLTWIPDEQFAIVFRSKLSMNFILAGVCRVVTRTIARFYKSHILIFAIRFSHVVDSYMCI